MDELDEIRLVVEELYAGLDVLPYHVFLGVDRDADGDALREAFHHRARRFHPDRFYALEDPELRTRVYAVYKRIAEAYRVLGDPELRREYEEQRRQGAIRLDKRERAGAPKRPEDTLTNPNAKKYYDLALEAERRNDARGARLNLQLALQFDPNNPLLKEKLEKYR